MRYKGNTHERQSHIPAELGWRLEGLKLTYLSCFGSWKPNIAVVCHFRYGARSLRHAVCQTPGLNFRQVVPTALCGSSPDMNAGVAGTLPQPTRAYP